MMELGYQNHNGDDLLGPNSTIVVYMDPLGKVIVFRVPFKGCIRVQGLFVDPKCYGFEG